MTRRNFAGVLCGVAVSGVAWGQSYRYSEEHRRPVETTLRDLNEVASDGRYDHNQRERFDNAIRHLQEFGDRLHEGGRFDKDKLDQAIGDVQSVIDHNRMGHRGRDVLLRDVTDLRELREHYDDRNRYH